MDFTREPVIQTVITPREGYRLVVRSSKSAGLEEHFVDAVEVVCFGTATFFRSIERPKPFIVPVTDYEVLEVREPRMVLKTPSETAQKSSEKPRSKGDFERVKVQEMRQETRAEKNAETKAPEKEEGDEPRERSQQASSEPKSDRRRDRRRSHRRRRGRGEEGVPEGEVAAQGEEVPSETLSAEDTQNILTTTPMLSSILPPPTLVSETLKELRKHDAYRDAFYDVEKESPFEESEFPQESFGYSESDVSMKEGGDQEVPQQDPFRDDEFFSEDAANAKKMDE